MTILLITGLYRFSDQLLLELNEFVQRNNIKKICFFYWESEKYSIKENNQLFAQLTVDHEIRYIESESVPITGRFGKFDTEDMRVEKQFGLLLYALTFFRKDDLIIRYRSDMKWFYWPQLPNSINSNTIYTSPFEGHENVPFEANVLNDQFWIGRADTITNLINGAFEVARSKKIVTRFGFRSYYAKNRGIEGLLSDSALQRNIRIRYSMGLYEFAQRHSSQYKAVLKYSVIRLHFIFFPVNRPSYLNPGFWVFFIAWKFKQQWTKIINAGFN